MSETPQQRERLTEGTQLWPLLALAAPLVASQLLQVLYNLADTFWVGRIGADAVSAISFAWPVVFLVITIGGGFTTAGTILVSQYTGAGSDDRTTHVAGQTLTVFILFSIPISAAGYLLTPQLLMLVGTTPGTEIHAMATTYTRTIFLGVVFMYGFFVFGSLLRGWGDTKTPMYLMAASVALNLLIDPIFIFGFQGNPLFGWFGLHSLQSTLFATTGFDGFGVQGAALATVISRALATAAGLWLLFTGRVGLHVSISDLRPKLATIRRIVRIGAPLSVENSTEAVAVAVMTAVIALVGTDAVAAYGIGTRLTSLVWFPIIAMGMSVETVVGQNLGAGKPDRARRTVLLASAILVAVFVAVTAFFFAFADPIISLFVTGEGAQAVVDYGVAYLHIVPLTYVVMAVFHMMNGAFHGAGSTRLSMALGVFSLWGVRAAGVAAFILVLGLGAMGAWYAIALSNVTALVVGSVFYFRGNWMDDVV